ncbi:MAG: hypothetical protein WBW81_05130 [Methylocella sp.]
MEISINGGKGMKLKEFKQRSWTDVDITDFVKNSPPLTEEQYQGISDGVYNISITPIPTQITETERGNGAPSRPPQGSKNGGARPVQVEKGERYMDVYALVIVKRSPFK